MCSSHGVKIYARPSRDKGNGIQRLYLPFLLRRTPQANAPQKQL